MNGIEALQALKDGKIVRYVRTKEHSTRDSLYIFRSPSIYDETPILFSKFVYQFTWHECTNNVRFWLLSDGFEIVDPNSLEEM